jgi:hypothetical protein
MDVESEHKMKIKEIIIESDIPAQPTMLPKDHTAGLKGPLSLPALSQNKSNGSSYMQYRFGLALAGAPDIPTPAVGAFSGDPYASTYTDVERKMIDFALDQVGGGKALEMGDNRSREDDHVHHVSPVRQVGAIVLKKK